MRKKILTALAMLVIATLTGIVMDFIGFLLFSFTYLEWVEIDWIFMRGVVATLTGFGILIAFACLCWDADDKKKDLSDNK